MQNQTLGSVVLTICKRNPPKASGLEVQELSGVANHMKNNLFLSATKGLLLLAVAALGTTSLANATTVACTITPSAGVTSVSGFLGANTVANIANATTAGSATIANMINCPGIAAVGVNFDLVNVKLMGAADYSNGNGSTVVTEVFCSLACGSFGAVNLSVAINGSFSSGNSVPVSPFQLGSTLNPGTNGSLSAFNVSIQSTVTSGGPVSNSTAQAYLSYDVQSHVPEPTTNALIGVSMLVMGFASRKFRKQS